MVPLAREQSPRRRSWESSSRTLPGQGRAAGLFERKPFLPRNFLRNRLIVNPARHVPVELLLSRCLPGVGLRRDVRDLAGEGSALGPVSASSCITACISSSAVSCPVVRKVRSVDSPPWGGRLSEPRQRPAPTIDNHPLLAMLGPGHAPRRRGRSWRARLGKIGASASLSSRATSVGSAPRRRLSSRCSRMASSSSPMTPPKRYWARRGSFSDYTSQARASHLGSHARGYSSAGRAPGSHPGGRGFESP